MTTGTAIITVSALALFVSTVYAVIAFLRLVAGRVWNSAVLQLIVWAAGVGVVFLFAASQLGRVISVNGLSFEAMNAATKVVVGLNVGSIAVVARETLTAIDASTSVALPALFRPRPPTPPAA